MADLISINTNNADPDGLVMPKVSLASKRNVSLLAELQEAKASGNSENINQAKYITSKNYSIGWGVCKFYVGSILVDLTNCRVYSRDYRYYFQFSYLSY